MKPNSCLSYLAILLAGACSAPVLAQHGEGHGRGPGEAHRGPGQAQRGHGDMHRGPGRQWRGDIARFHEHDWPVWRGGHWSHVRHGGRLGWWWIVGPSWYFYPAPVYPYPSPWEPADVMITGPDGMAPMPPAQFWYYCDASQTYYPYATFCPSGWKQVPAAPDSTAPSPIPRVP